MKISLNLSLFFIYFFSERVSNQPRLLTETQATKSKIDSIESDPSKLTQVITEKFDVITQEPQFEVRKEDSKKMYTHREGQMNKSVVQRQYDLINIKAKEENPNMSLSEYFNTNLNGLECLDHLKFLDLNYSCVDNTDEHFPRDMNLYIVEKNFEKYYMRLDDSPVKYEILLEKSLKIEGIVLHLLEHKIIHRRFVGIYKYEKNLGLLDQYIKTQNPSVYSIYTLMHALTQMLLTIMADRDPKNPFLNINILPTNIMIMDSKTNLLKLIRIIPFSQREIMKLSTPETVIVSSFVDKRSYHVFLLGKVFYFLCFKIFPTKTDTSLLNFLADYKEEDIDEGEPVIDKRIIYLMRRMLNNSPVDRPPLSEVLDTIDEVKSETTFFLATVKDYMEQLFQKMLSEVEVEKFKNSAKKNNIFLSPHDTNNIEILPEGMIEKEEEALRNKSKMIQEMLNLKIKEEINVNDKFGMIKDMVIEDMIDDNLRENLNEKRKRAMNVKSEDVRDRLESIGDYMGHMKVIEKYVSRSKAMKGLDQALRKEYINLMRTELMMENYNLLNQQSKGHDHGHDEEDEFPIQYVFFLIFVVIIIAICVSSLYLRNSKFMKWNKSEFHTHLISQHMC